LSELGLAGLVVGSSSLAFSIRFFRDRARNEVASWLRMLVFLIVLLAVAMWTLLMVWHSLRWGSWVTTMLAIANACVLLASAGLCVLRGKTKESVEPLDNEPRNADG
jgi:hypothetical protein